MNIPENDYQGLLNQISSSTDKNFTEFQIISLVDEMQTLGWQGSKRIVAMAIRNGNMPRNVYGYILNLLEEETERIKREEYDKNEWKAVKDCASPEEFILTMKCISLISQFNNSAELLKKFGEYLKIAHERGNLLDALNKSVVFYTNLLNNNNNSNADI